MSHEPPTPRELLLGAHAELAASAEALGARVVTLLDPDYPASLAAIAGPPPVLAVRGRLPPGPAVAIVGSRLPDGYGREVAGLFARYLAAAGVVVVSGLARGIDAAAHEGALAAPSGWTVAVLGCGLGVDYPRGHARLAAAIAARGALVSEFPGDATPQPWRFPVRNRTIAGLAAVTLVVQATPRSGALDTARHARDLGRAVFAVPGPVFAPLSWGPHALLRGGAQLAAHPEDVLDALPARPAATAARAADPAPAPADAAPAPAGPAPAAAGTASAAAGPASAAADDDDGPTPDGAPTPGGAAATAASAPAAAEAILAALGRRAVRSAEQVAARAGLAPGAALQALLELEVAGRIERVDGLAYRLPATPRRR